MLLRNPELARVHGELEGIIAQARVYRTISRRQMHWTPGAGKWSIAESMARLAHLLDASKPGIEDAMVDAKCKARITHDPGRYSLLERSLIRAFEPRLHLPFLDRCTVAVALSPREPEQCYVQCRTALRTVQGLLVASDGLPLDCSVVAHPFVPVLRCRLGAFYQLLAAVGRRHMAHAADMYAAAPRLCLLTTQRPAGSAGTGRTELPARP